MGKRQNSDTKVCNSCGVEKPLTEFWTKTEKRVDGSLRYRPYCKECGIKDRLEKYHNNNGKELQKKRSFRSLLKSYGIDEEIYEQERVKQNYRCCLCGAHENEQHHKRLYVDHCHKTGKYRGLLCNLCNTGLGALKDNTEVLQKAIEYLNENSSRHRNEHKA
jgi:hypothetical protein